MTVLFRQPGQKRSMPKTCFWVACALVVCTAGCGFRTARPSSTQLALAAADSFRTAQITAGVKHLFAWQASGPWAIHVLEVSHACNAIWEARKAGPILTSRATTSALGSNALAAINADFFALPAGTPVGVQVRASEVLVGPAERPIAVAFTHQGAWIDEARLDARVRTSSVTASVAHINRPRLPNAPPAIRLFTRWFGVGAPADTQMTTIGIRVTGRNQGIAELVDSTGNAIWLDDSQVVLHVPRAMSIATGDTVTWHAQILPARGGLAAREAVGGFPWLIRGSQNVLDQQPGVRPDFSEQRHPRTAIGFTADRRALLVVVDGRQPPYSTGMTLPELTDLMIRLGAVDALNLDGGGSATMVIRGHPVNRPSDREGERAVGNALTLVRCR